MNKIKAFENREFGQVRTLLRDDEVWFVATDVCNALELTNVSMVVGRLDDDERSKLNLGRQGEVNIVNEYGLYNLVMASRKPEAKKFKRWITHEVLPSIRKHGAYITAEKLEEVLLSPDTLIKLANNLKEEQERNKELTERIEEDKPKVLFAESVETAKNSCLVGELAKILKQNGVNIGQNRLFEWLRENGYLIRSGESYNLPTQYSMDLELMEIKKSIINMPDGVVKTTRTTKITGKGQIYFVNKFLKVS